MKYYVSMLDKFMSGWGPAEGKMNRLVIECDTVEEAQIVRDNARARSEMSGIEILKKKPVYAQNAYFTSYHDKTDYDRWFVEGAFKN